LKTNNTYVNVQKVKLEIQARTRKKREGNEKKKLTDIQKEVRSDKTMEHSDINVNRKIRNKRNRLITVQPIEHPNTKRIGNSISINLSINQIEMK